MLILLGKHVQDAVFCVIKVNGVNPVRWKFNYLTHILWQNMNCIHLLIFSMKLCYTYVEH